MNLKGCKQPIENMCNNGHLDEIRVFYDSESGQCQEMEYSMIFSWVYFGEQNFNVLDILNFIYF